MVHFVIHSKCHQLKTNYNGTLAVISRFGGDQKDADNEIVNSNDLLPSQSAVADLQSNYLQKCAISGICNGYYVIIK